MHTVYWSYLEFENKHSFIIELIELLFLPHNQYMGPYIFSYNFLIQNKIDFHKT